jgi:hypothetical protein
MRKKWMGNRTSANEERDCLGVMRGRGSDRMTVIEGRTCRTKIFVATIAVETRESSFPGDDRRDRLRVYRFVKLLKKPTR